MRPQCYLLHCDFIWAWRDMDWWDKKAGILSDKVWIDHVKNVDDPYGDEGVKVAIAHTRQDLVLICSQLSSLNKQISNIKWYVLIIVVIEIVGLFR